MAYHVANERLKHAIALGPRVHGQDHPELNGYPAPSRTAWIAWQFHAEQGANARARRSLHRVSSNPSQPPYPRHSRRTGLRQPSYRCHSHPLALVLISLVID